MGLFFLFLFSLWDAVSTYFSILSGNHEANILYISLIESSWVLFFLVRVVIIPGLIYGIF